MNKNNFTRLTIIRYIIYFAVAASIIVSANKGMVLLLVLLLVYIINAQVRLYIFNKKRYAIILSIMFEVVIISVMCSLFGGFTFIYYFLSLMDSSIMLPQKGALILDAVIYLAVIFESLHPNYGYLQNYPLINAIFNTLIVAGFAILGRYVNEQASKKAEAQKLYDDLRISQEQLKDAYKRLEQYSNTVEELAVLKERNRISREIHDTVGHTLTTLIVQLQSLPFLIKSDSSKAEETLSNMLEYTKYGLEDVRRAVRELNPSAFDNTDSIFVLHELVYNFEKNSGIKVKFNIAGDGKNLNSEEGLILYRIIQESFNNSLRHGKASFIDVNLNISPKEIYMRIKDNGTGCGEYTPGFGISGMQQRIKNAGGSIEFRTGEGTGFETNVLLPKNLVIV